MNRAAVNLDAGIPSEWVGMMGVTAGPAREAPLDRLAPGGWVHSCWFSAAFVAFCDQQGLRALEYVEQVRDHWYAGGRCGLARRGVRR